MVGLVKGSGVGGWMRGEEMNRWMGGWMHGF
jgi:hypothetical protein